MNRLEPETTAAFGLVAWLEQTKISLPLKGVECRFDVTAGVASVEIDQIFHQSHAQALDCTYTFPLPSGAAVYRCEMHVNGRVIRAKIEAREDARRIFVEQKAAGRRAAMVEAERDNVFTLSLGNLQPQDVVVIRFAYFQTLERIGAQQRLRVPVCPGVRYIPGQPLLRALSGRGTVDDTDQVPDASRITPPRIDALHPDAAYFAAAGVITRADVAEGTLSSPTHRLLIHAGEERHDVALATNGAVPDRDLVVTWNEPREAALEPRAWTFADGGETFALVQLRAPAEVGVTEAFEQDFYFLVDRSGSMSGAKWIKTCEALTGFVNLLGKRDRVWITLFESGVQDFAEAPLAAPRVLADAGFRDLVRRGVGGGTNLLPAAEHVLAKLREHSSARSATVVLITDGQVGNDEAILQRFSRETGVAVHTFGIDTAVNDVFLKRLARQHGGDCWLQTPNDDIAATVSGLADRLRRPVLTGLTVSGGWEPAGSRLANVHAGQVIDVVFRSTMASPLEISGQLGDGKAHHFPLTAQPTSNVAIKLLWARERIETLIGNGARQPALDLAKRHNLLCEGAAFIAWDEEEKVMVAQREIVQPSLQVARFLEGARVALASACQYEIGASESVIPRRHSVMERRATYAPALRWPKGPARASSPLDGGIRLALVNIGLEFDLALALEKWADAKWLKRLSRRAAVAKFIADMNALGGDFAALAARCLQFTVEHLNGEAVLQAAMLKQVAVWDPRVQV